MKFYFCEGCGKRITENDIEQGLGKDKKLKGVYCKGCSVGVMTMETVPLTDEAAKELLKDEKSKQPALPPSEPTLKRSAKRHSSARQIPLPGPKERPKLGDSSRRVKPPDHEVKGNASQSWLAGVAIAGVILIGITIFVASNFGSSRVQKKAKKTPVGPKTPRQKGARAKEEPRPQNTFPTDTKKGLTDPSTVTPETIDPQPLPPEISDPTTADKQIADGKDPTPSNPVAGSDPKTSNAEVPKENPGAAPPSDGTAERTKKKIEEEEQHAKLLAQKKKEQELNAAESGLATLLGDIFGLLSKGAYEEASSRMQGTDKDSILTPVQEKCSGLQYLISKGKALEAATVQGALALKDGRPFVLTVTEGAPISIGKGQKFQVMDVNDDKLMIGQKNMSMPLALSRLTGATRRDLARLSLKNEGPDLVLRAAFDLLTMGKGKGAVSPEEVRASIRKARKAGGPTEDLDGLSLLVEVAEKVAKEKEAQNLVDRFEKQLSAKQWAQAYTTGQQALDDFSDTKALRDLSSFQERVESARRKGAPVQDYEFVFQEGRPLPEAGVDLYLGTRATSLYNYHANRPWPGGPNLNCQTDRFKILIRFILTEKEGGILPEETEVLEAKLAIYKSGAYAPCLTLKPLTKAWNPKWASFNSADKGQKWDSPGGDTLHEEAQYVELDKIHHSSSYKPQWCEFDVTKCLRKALKNGKNFGWRMEAFGSKTNRGSLNTVSFASPQHGPSPKFRPKLTLKFRAPRFKLPQTAPPSVFSEKGVLLTSKEGKPFIKESLKELTIGPGHVIKAPGDCRVMIRGTEGQAFTLYGQVMFGGSSGGGVEFILRESGRDKYRIFGGGIRVQGRLLEGKKSDSTPVSFTKRTSGKWIPFKLEVSREEIRYQLGPQGGVAKGPLTTDGSNTIVFGKGGKLRGLHLKLNKSTPIKSSE